MHIARLLYPESEAMSQVHYPVPGDADYQARLYPPPGVIDPNPPPHSLLGR
jgi:hypothetical protein